MNSQILLSRDTFRESVFKRDKYTCVICGKEAKDAHHIIDRKLFKDGSQGYFIDNGASLCSSCHIDAENWKKANINYNNNGHY